MKTLLPLVVSFLIACAAPSSGAERAIVVNVVTLIGHIEPDATAPIVTMAPGSVLVQPAASESATRSFSFVKLKRELKESYRLAELAVAGAEPVLLDVGDEDQRTIGDSPVTATIRLDAFDEEAATLTIALESAGKVVARPTIKARRGEWATIGGRNGEAAPYFFLLVRPGTDEDRARAERERGLTVPKVITSVMPTYPEAARKSGITGVVVLAGIVGADGRMRNIRVLDSEAPELDQAAIDALAAYRFEPARDAAGRAVEIEYAVTFEFRLTCGPKEGADRPAPGPGGA